jgi:hypothetical protein
VGTVKITTNADKVARQIRAYAGQLQSKYSKALERIAQLGGGTAKVKFANALYAGDNDVTVDVKRVSATKYQVIASGKTVLFIEFGTGGKFREYDSSDTEFTPPPHGSYGKGKGANPHGWYYTASEGAHGRHTYGNQPAEAMLTARDVMVERVVRVAKEVFQ